MKTYGNIILMTVICIVIFWVFMALRPASAGGCPQCGGDGFPLANPPPRPTLTSRDVACIRANYASTFALERCAKAIGTSPAGSRKGRR